VSALYPPLEPHVPGLLDVGEGNRVYWESRGNRDGRAALAAQVVEALDGFAALQFCNGAWHQTGPFRLRAICRCFGASATALSRSRCSSVTVPGTGRAPTGRGRKGGARARRGYDALRRSSS
jgi:hypothetical protein